LTKKTVQISIKGPKDMGDALDEATKIFDKTKTDLVRGMIEDGLKVLLSPEALRNLLVDFDKKSAWNGN
jgi:hypothetical protein